MSDADRSASVDNRILRLWGRWGRAPLKRKLFSMMFGRVAPFNGVISPRVLEVRPGLARVAMRERRRLHQHLGSVHAGALFTLAECTSGLALSASIPDDMRIIVTDISIEFRKKAHGLIIASAHTEIPDPTVEARHQVTVTLTDPAGDTVAEATVSWLIGPRKPKG